MKRWKSGNRRVRWVPVLLSTNLFLAGLVVVVWIVYGLRHGQPLAYECLGFRTTSSWPAWVDVLILEGMLLGSCAFRNWAPRPEAIQHLVGGIGAFGLCITFILPMVQHNLFGFPFPTVPQVIGWYVWGSHAAYALLPTDSGSDLNAAVHDR